MSRNEIVKISLFAVMTVVLIIPCLYLLLNISLSGITIFIGFASLVTITRFFVGKIQSSHDRTKQTLSTNTLLMVTAAEKTIYVCMYMLAGAILYKSYLINPDMTIVMSIIMVAMFVIDIYRGAKNRNGNPANNVS